jgi:hypothetical protein
MWKRVEGHSIEPIVERTSIAYGRVTVLAYSISGMIVKQQLLDMMMLSFEVFSPLGFGVERFENYIVIVYHVCIQVYKHVFVYLLKR